ncbi:MAG: TIGR04086 family membrane protein [Clostridia bacterium]|nr:TIGR04086 family membrane protein [Clostridia bacterium]
MSREIKYNLSEKSVIYGLSLLVGIIFSIASMLLAAALCLATDMSEELSSPISALCVGTGALVSGFLSSRKLKSGGLINGAICGLVLYALIFFFSLIFSESGFSFVSLYHALITIISAMIGGVLGVLSAAKKKVI